MARGVAAEQWLVCRGVLWLLDAVFAESPEKGAVLHAGLTRLAEHPRCRLPRFKLQNVQARGILRQQVTVAPRIDPQVTRRQQPDRCLVRHEAEADILSPRGHRRDQVNGASSRASPLSSDRGEERVEWRDLGN